MVLLKYWIVFLLMFCLADNVLSVVPASANPPQNVFLSQKDDYAEYWPWALGSRWVYKITLGDVYPLFFRETIWLQENGEVKSADTRLYLYNAEGRKEFQLAFRVARPTSQQGPLQWQGVELEIERDELEIFKDCKEVFWAKNREEETSILQVTTYAPSDFEIRARGETTRIKEGFSLRLVCFFSRSENVIRGAGLDIEHQSELLWFKGPEGSRLHFVRLVAEMGKDLEFSGPPDNLQVLNQAFEEHLWLEKSKGLVRLEQRIKGEISMTWELAEFSK